MIITTCHVRMQWQANTLVQRHSRYTMFSVLRPLVALGTTMHEDEWLLTAPPIPDHEKSSPWETRIPAFQHTIAPELCTLILKSTEKMKTG